MARITKEQKAATDFVDQLCFDQLVVHWGMTAAERKQIKEIVTRVNQMAEEHYSGANVEAIKHLAYCFLEVNLANTRDELKKAIPVDVEPLDLPEETIAAFDRHNINYQMAFMLVSIEKTTGFDASYALEIFETLKDEFVGYSALVRRDLVKRCLAWEFKDAPLMAYCWLTVTGVLPARKNGPERINNPVTPEFITRLTLLASHEMVIHYLKITLGKTSIASVLVRDKKLKLKENYIDSLLNVESVFNEACLRPSLRSVPQITVCEFNNPKRVKKFFSNWGSRKTKLRMHTGTLASWPGFLGTAMLEIRLASEYLSAAQEKFRLGTHTVAMTDLKVPAIFNAFDNHDTLSAEVQGKLAAYGLQINADTLYRTHAVISKTTLHILYNYCQLTRTTGVVMSPTEDDIWYMSLFIHGNEVAVRQL
ncbi:hypothetical protein ABRP92_02025 [Pectobacterium aroidearum]|uniref:hypothetical protein n=1 Tax=Pectobacterium aroidearum TaxID=1201031 RepID=UPI0032F006A7